MKLFKKYILTAASVMSILMLQAFSALSLGAQPASLSFDFTQVKSSQMLSEPVTTRGRMAYLSPDKIRWEYTSPYESLFIMNGDRILTRNSSGEKESKAKNGSVYTRISRLMTSLLASDSGRVEGFESEREDCGAFIRLRLVPVDSSTKRLFREVEVRIDKKLGVATRVEIEEKNGDHTTIVCSNVKVDPALDSALFEF